MTRQRDQGPKYNRVIEPYNAGLSDRVAWRRFVFLGIRFARLDLAGSTVHLNSGADIVSTAVDPDAKRVRFALKSTPGFGVHTMLAPVPRPHKVRMGKRELASVEEDRLDALDEGWGYHAPLKAIVLKTTPGDGPGDGAVSCEIVWE